MLGKMKISEGLQTRIRTVLAKATGVNDHVSKLEARIDSLTGTLGQYSATIIQQQQQINEQTAYIANFNVAQEYSKEIIDELRRNLTAIEVLISTRDRELARLKAENEALQNEKNVLSYENRENIKFLEDILSGISGIQAQHLGRGDVVQAQAEALRRINVGGEERMEVAPPDYAHAITYPKPVASAPVPSSSNPFAPCANPIVVPPSIPSVSSAQPLTPVQYYQVSQTQVYQIPPTPYVPPYAPAPVAPAPAPMTAEEKIRAEFLAKKKAEEAKQQQEQQVIKDAMANVVQNKLLETKNRYELAKNVVLQSNKTWQDKVMAYLTGLDTANLAMHNSMGFIPQSFPTTFEEAEKAYLATVPTAQLEYEAIFSSAKDYATYLTELAKTPQACYPFPLPPKPPTITSDKFLSLTLIPPMAPAVAQVKKPEVVPPQPLTVEEAPKKVIKEPEVVSDTFFDAYSHADMLYAKIKAIRSKYNGLSAITASSETLAIYAKHWQDYLKERSRLWLAEKNKEIVTHVLAAPNINCVKQRWVDEKVYPFPRHVYSGADIYMQSASEAKPLIDEMNADPLLKLAFVKFKDKWCTDPAVYVLRGIEDSPYSTDEFKAISFNYKFSVEK